MVLIWKEVHKSNGDDVNVAIFAEVGQPFLIRSLALRGKQTVNRAVIDGKDPYAYPINCQIGIGGGIESIGQEGKQGHGDA